MQSVTIDQANKQQQSIEDNHLTYKNNQIIHQQSLDMNNSSNIVNKNKHKKRYKKKLRKHSPDYYQQLKLTKLNFIREVHWDNRFMLDSIPLNNIMNKSNKKLHSNKRNKTKQIFLQQLPHPMKGLTTNFPPLTTNPKRKTNQSFKIKVLSKKQGIKTQNKSIESSQNQKIINEIERLYENAKFPQFYKKILINLCQRLYNNKTKVFLTKQLKQLQNYTSQIFVALNSIQKRQKLLQLFKDKQLDQPSILQYQQISLKCVQEILKWKQQISEVYKFSFNKQKKFEFLYNDKNYLLEIGNYKRYLNKFEEGKDPFIVCCEYQIPKQQLLKIRACQLLLLQEELIHQK